MIYLLRANHTNQFELQNYAPITNKLKIEVITSHHPLTDISIPSTKLWSPTDFFYFPFRRQILNRLIGGEQWLIGLDSLVSKRSNDSNYRTIIHTAETYTPYTHQAVELRKRGEISKLICTCWETIPHNNEKFARLRKWKSEAYRYVDIFHTPTNLAKKALITEGVEPNKILVIPYGVDLSRFCPSTIQGGKLKGKRPLVLTVARLAIEKGIEDIEVVASQLPQYDFLVVGKGTYNPRGSNIQVSSVPYSQIHKIYQKSDLFFLPSRTTSTWEEQFGMVLIEAMACGLPIITTDSGAISEVVDNSAIIIPEQKASLMSEAIIALLSNATKRSKYSSLSLSRAKKLYDSRKIAAKLAKLYT